MKWARGFATSAGPKAASSGSRHTPNPFKPVTHIRAFQWAFGFGGTVHSLYLRRPRHKLARSSFRALCGPLARIHTFWLHAFVCFFCMHFLFNCPNSRSNLHESACSNCTKAFIHSASRMPQARCRWRTSRNWTGGEVNDGAKEQKHHEGHYGCLQLSCASLRQKPHPLAHTSGIA